MLPVPQCPMYIGCFQVFCQGDPVEIWSHSNQAGIGGEEDEWLTSFFKSGASVVFGTQNVCRNKGTVRVHMGMVLGRPSQKNEWPLAILAPLCDLDNWDRL